MLGLFNGERKQLNYTNRQCVYQRVRFRFRPGVTCYLVCHSTCLKDLHNVIVTRRTYRDYVNTMGQNVAVEAGPNGPENVR